jgi:hypothetical protein
MFIYRFKVIMQNNLLKNVSGMMRKLDLDIGEAGVEQKFQLTSKKDIPIPKVKQYLKTAIEACEMTVLHMEGGKIE